MFESIFSITFVFQILRITVPYALTSLGATFSERGGVVNIGLEGLLLIGAFATTLVTFYTGQPIAGILVGILAGITLSSLHAMASISFRVNQIVSGIAVNLFALGLTKFCCKIIFQSSSNSPRITGFELYRINALREIPIIGLLIDNPFIIITVVLLMVSNVVLWKTRYGLRLRAVGENPEAAESLGLHVNRLRYYGVLLSGAFSGLGGAFLALDQHSFTDGMSAGRGYIALAAMIVGKWTPYGAAAAALLFGVAEAIVITWQGGSIPTQFIQMIPYLLTIVVLAGFIGKATPPRASGIPYEKH